MVPPELDAETVLVGAVGAFVRSMPAQELPAALRRLQGFRPQTLLKHRAAVLAALDDAELRAKIIDWLDVVKPSLTKAELEILRIAALREEGWEEALSSRSAPPAPRRKTDPTARLAAELEREKSKLKRARDDLKRTKEIAARAGDARAAQIADLKKELDAARVAIESSAAAAAAGRQAAESARMEADRSVRKAARSLEKTEADAIRARTELKELRRELTAATKDRHRLEERVASLEARLERVPKGPAPASESGSKRRVPLPVPKGRLPSDPQTLDEWLSTPDVRVLIDGYNVTMAKGGFGDLRLETQRERLITELAGLASMKGVPMTVVFDGKEVDRHPTRKKKGLVRVHYSKDEIADDHLVALVQRSPGTPVVVVTSDRELAGRVEKYGANVAGSPQLLSLLR